MAPATASSPTLPTAHPEATQQSRLHRALAELGLLNVHHAPRDVKLFFAQRFVRLFAYGGSTLVLTLLLSALGVSATRIGLFMTLTLLGDVSISFLLTLCADGIGRRRVLAAGALMMAGSGVVFAWTGNYWILLAASVLGVITPSGNEIGPFRAIEESTLAQLTPQDVRPDIFAWYEVVGATAAALGTIASGWGTSYLQSRPGAAWSDVQSYRVVFAAYAALGLVKLFLTLMLSDKCEEAEAQKKGKEQEQGDIEMDSAEVEGLLSDEEDDDDAKDARNIKKPVNGNHSANASPRESTANSKPTNTTRSKLNLRALIPTISPESRSILCKLCLLFAVDSGASGLVPPSWIIYFFNTKFGLPPSTLGSLFFATNLVSSASNLVASSLARRIGLVRTMVFTHLPSSVFLLLIPFPSVAWLAMAFLVGRASLSQMDRAPRQAFLAAVVLPEERTAVMGFVNVVKTLAQSGGPAVTGALASAGAMWTAFVAAGCMKVVYDFTILKLFVGHKTRS